LRKELAALETQKHAILGEQSGHPMNHLPIYDMASRETVWKLGWRGVNEARDR
jgi:hypothetical protein